MRTRLAVPNALVTLTLCLCLGCPFFTGAPTVEHGNVAFDISPDGETLVFSDAEGDLWLFGLTTKTVTRLTSTADRESTPSFSPDGKTIVYASTHDNGKGTSIFSRSIDGAIVRRLTHDEQFSDNQPSFASDGKTIAFARAHLHRRYSLGGWKWDRWDVYVVGADGTNIRRLTESEHYDIAGVSFSADSQNGMECRLTRHLQFMASQFRWIGYEATGR